MFIVKVLLLLFLCLIGLAVCHPTQVLAERNPLPLPMDGEETVYPRHLRMLAQGLSAKLKEYKAYLTYSDHVRTPGFKRYKVGVRLTGDQIIPEKYIVWSKEDPVATERNLDLYVSGATSFFTVEMLDGSVAYTQDGRFMRGLGGKLVTIAYGLTVMGEDGPIILPPDYSDEQIAIQGDGEVYAGDDFLGKLKITVFDSPEGLWGHQGTLFYVYDPERSKIVTNPGYFVRQGFYEGANGEFFIGDSKLIRPFYEAMAATTKEVLKTYDTMFKAVGPD